MDRLDGCSCRRTSEHERRGERGDEREVFARFGIVGCMYHLMLTTSVRSTHVHSRDWGAVWHWRAEGDECLLRNPLCSDGIDG